MDKKRLIDIIYNLPLSIRDKQDLTKYIQEAKNDVNIEQTPDGTSLHTVIFTQSEDENLETLKELSITDNYNCILELSDTDLVQGSYYNGTITGIYDAKLTKWDVNFDTGHVTEAKQIDIEQIACIVELQVATAGTPEAEINLERLRATLGGHFFCDIDHGLGVGTFQDGVGGYAHITTAYGVDAYYNISPAGQITVDTTKQDIDLVIQDLTARIEALERV